jgi:hypothetical protein
MEADVAAAITLLQTEGKPITADAVKALVTAPPTIDVPHLAAQPVDLILYDALITQVAA